MRSVRWLALLLVLLQLVLLLGACGGEEGKTTAGTPGGTTGKAPGQTTAPKVENNTTSPKGETTAPKDDGNEEEDPYLYLVVDGEAQYKIINPLTTSDENVALVRDFANELEEATGASFEIGVETLLPESGREILVCAYANRPEAAEVGKLVSYTGYRLDVVGETIVLSTYSNYLKKMLDSILDSLEELQDGTWAVDRDMIAIERDLYANRTIPVYETVNGRVEGNGVYPNGYDGYTVSIVKSNAEEFAAYLAKVEGLGYTRYDSNSIGLVDFYTYTKGDATLYLQYNTSDLLKGPSARMTLAFGETLPATSAAPYEAVVDSSINSLARATNISDYNTRTNWGLGMIFQLADGSYVIVDGGYDGTGADAAILLNFMNKNKPASHEKPVIACWIWTHAHGDHVDLCRRMMSAWTNKVEIRSFGYNFVDFTVLTEYVGTETDPGSYYGSEMISEAKKYYPDTPHWIMRAGQKMYVADAVIECIWSHEDVYPSKLDGVNDTNIAFSITIDGVKTMMLGDCQNPNSKMISWYREAMKSPVVQNAHHTINGPTLMYEYIDPMYSFWACCDWEMQQMIDVREHAKWLISTRWERTDENGDVVSGERTHYHINEDIRLYIKDLKQETAGLS